MTSKIAYSLVALACLVAAPVNAQQNNDGKTLSKEITLEKDFVPTEKKATKKNELPAVKRIAPTSSKSTMTYSDWTQPVDVPTTIPTMMPYGYRTAHLFDDHRGYLNVGGGSQANFTGSFGYRIIDTEKTSLNAWLQHNSTWLGHNNSPVVPTDSYDRNKQMYNDNAVGVNYSNTMNAGTLNLGARFHLDNFNYYGGWGSYWEDTKQMFIDLALNAGWAGRLTVKGQNLNYNAALSYGHGSYDKPLDDRYKSGVTEDRARLKLGATYELATGSLAGLTLTGDYLNRRVPAYDKADKMSDDIGMITVSPFYEFANDIFNLHLGANMAISFSDGATLRFSPAVRIDITPINSFSIYALADGGKSLGYIDPAHHLNRYDHPMSFYSSSYVPLHVEGGFNVGPFTGFSARLFGGYGITKNRADVCYYATLLEQATQRGLATDYTLVDARGAYFGGEVNYRYRSLVDFHAGLTYAPRDKEYKSHWYGGYSQGYDRAKTVANVSVNVYPIKRLGCEVGLDYRGGRATLFNDDAIFTLVDLDDVIDLHLGANYRFDRTLTLWARVGNLLNRKWDTLYGLGAQRINVMAGINLVF